MGGSVQYKACAELPKFFINWYSKTYVKRPLKNRQNKDLNDNGSLMKV